MLWRGTVTGELIHIGAALGALLAWYDPGNLTPGSAAGTLATGYLVQCQNRFDQGGGLYQTLARENVLDGLSSLEGQ